MRASPSAFGSLHAVADRLGNLRGWRRRGFLALMGAMSVLAVPPVNVIPILLISLPALVWVWDGSESRRAAFGAGWWWGLGWYSVGFYWIAEAMLIEPEKFGWAIPFATLGLGGLMAVYPGMATWLARLPGVRGPGRILLLAAAWTLGEWLRTFVLTGFPWNPIGSVWDGVLPVLQAGALVGVHGLSLMTVLVFALPAAAAAASGWRGRAAAFGLAAALPLAAYGWGTARLAATPETMVPGVRLRLVQAALAQGSKWRDDQRERNLQTQIALSRQPGFGTLTHVIWPETAASYFLDLDLAHRAQVVQAAPPGGLIVTGAPRVTPRGVEPFQVWNSLFAITSDGRIDGVYDKAHLVPFGEYVPLRGILPLSKITPGAVDFSPGPGPRTLILPGVPPVSPFICYEAIFPGAVVAKDSPRPQWLLNITNDGWFGTSAGPYQHLAAARMRAVEEGLPLVRAANTGISAVFDGLGRDVARLGLGKRGVLDAPLPAAPPGITLYGRWGDVIPLSLAAVAALLGIGFSRRR
ncbi:MAG: apolipoprotein N-acyltransferase [Magnetospirillum sp.]|nr:apolipoprotein N-acyltransferase [Magnetospirillum sp.]